MSTPAPSPKVGFVSLGCPKALVDSEQILTQLRAEGYAVAPTYQDADLVIVNTCGFIDAAVEESLDAIGEALAENGKVIVTGCLGAKGDIVQQTHPQVLAVTGPHALQEVMSAVHSHLPAPHDPFVSLIPMYTDVQVSREAGSRERPPQGVRLTPQHYAYLKISEGCNHRCTFCIIPSMRGDLVSRPVSDVMQEAENLVNAGVKELLVISQDTSAYGVDVKYRTGFWRGRPMKTHITPLAGALGELGVWVRLHYVYPYPHVDDLIPLMADGKIVPYLDVPLQHASPTILKAMKRPANSENTLARIQRWRTICPEITLRSTFIVGFPGETDDDFERLLDFLRVAELDRVGAFAYSAVEGARANALLHPVPEEVKQERLARLMAAQEAISAAKLQRRVGRVCRVLIDAVSAAGASARSVHEAPEVDGVIRFPAGAGARAGEWAQVRITGADTHDLVADKAC